MFDTFELTDLKAFNYPSNTEFEAGIEGIYLPLTSEVITRRLEKVVVAKTLVGINNLEIAEDKVSQLYKYSVKKLNKMSFSNYDEFNDTLNGLLWELGDVPTHEIEDVEEVVNSHIMHPRMYNVFMNIVNKAKNLRKVFKHSDILIDLNSENYLEDELGNIVGFDAIWMEIMSNKDREKAHDYLKIKS